MHHGLACGSSSRTLATLAAALVVACSGAAGSSGRESSDDSADGGCTTASCGSTGTGSTGTGITGDDDGTAPGNSDAGAAPGSTGGGPAGATDGGTSVTADGGALAVHDGGSTSGSDSGSSGGGGSLDPNAPPGGNFNLSGWQLQLPIGSTNSPQTESGSQLSGANGFTDLYFYTDKTDGAMTFMDPTTGVTTSGSLHPRSELREVTDGWGTTGTNTETVTVAVTEVPDHVTIGQIFQASPAPSKPLMELQYLKGGTIEVLLEDTNQGGSATFPKVGTVVDGAKFTYELSLTGTTITVTINGKATELTLPSTFVGESFYFKCGDYDQSAVKGTPGTSPGTIVKIYSLAVVHE